MTHVLRITSTWDYDGHEDSWFYVHPGDADEAHDNLARRWKAAGKTFTRDRANRTLTRHYDGAEVGGGYTDEIVHEEMGR